MPLYIPTPAEHIRQQLLHDILFHGEQVQEKNAILRNAFTDVNIASWCMDNQIKYEVDSYRRVHNNDTWEFITFRKIEDSEL